ncbi:MAG: hypothetical protein K6G83_05245 [Lachnospiraceae bacterium]|nr:hypothetical protein [Lachnospiraceae bacterium]
MRCGRSFAGSERTAEAEIMVKAGRGYLGADAAKLYRELGEEDKCAEFFEKSKQRYQSSIFRTNMVQ